MGRNSRLMLVTGLLAVMGFSGCGPCRCGNGARFANATTCAECFQQCTAVDSAPVQCLPSDVKADAALAPIPDPTFTAVE